MSMLGAIAGSIERADVLLVRIDTFNDAWVKISCFLVFLITFLVITTSYKSRKIKELKNKIKELEK